MQKEINLTKTALSKCAILDSTFMAWKLLTVFVILSKQT